MAAPEQSFPLYPAQLVSPPLIGQSSFEVEGTWSTPCRCVGSSHWANHFQPAQQELTLRSHAGHGQGLPQEGGSDGQLSLLRPHLTSLSLLGPSYPHSWGGQVVYQCVEVLGTFSKGSNYQTFHLLLDNLLPCTNWVGTAIHYSESAKIWALYNHVKSMLCVIACYMYIDIDPMGTSTPSMRKNQQVVGKFFSSTHNWTERHCI